MFQIQRNPSRRISFFTVSFLWALKLSMKMAILPGFGKPCVFGFGVEMAIWVRGS